MGVAEAPTVAVVICAYTEQRWDLIGQAVESVGSQTHPATVVVLVIDHNDALLTRARAAWPEHTVVANEHRKGLSGARNTGVDHAAGAGVVAFIDDDAKAHSTWIEQLVGHFERPDVGAVGGLVRPVWIGQQPPWFPSEFLWVVGCSYVGLPDSVASIRNPIGANMAFRRDLVVAAGGFNEDIGRVGTLPAGCEETELSIRVRRLGADVIYDPGAVVDHVVPVERGRFSYFVRRCLAEGKSKAAVTKMAGASRALQSERAYVRTTLPTAFGAALLQVLRGPSRADALRRAAAIPAGLAATTGGYVSATLRWKPMVALTPDRGPDRDPERTPVGPDRSPGRSQRDGASVRGQQRPVRARRASRLP
jgi:glucosyl-dolichyl phosphate glucuronosyltransferase